MGFRLRDARPGALVLASLFFCVPAALAGGPDFASLRERMVREDIEGRGIRDGNLLKVLREIPRHLFVPPDLKEVAYGDRPLPIGEGQTISQPYVVAYMTEALRLKGGERVLEIGTGSGYQAAVLSRSVKDVYTIEIRQGLAQDAERKLKELGHTNAHVKQADGYFGWTEAAPFDAIMITAAANHIPPPLLRQLKEGGTLVLPLGSTAYYQTLVRITKKGGKFDHERLIDVRFVPMTGEVEKHERAKP